MPDFRQPLLLLVMLIKGAHSEPPDWDCLRKRKLTKRISKRDREIDRSVWFTYWECHQVNPQGVTGASVQWISPHAGLVLGWCSDSAIESISSLTWRPSWQLRELHQRALFSRRTRQSLGQTSQWIHALLLFASCPFYLPPAPCRHPNWSSGSSPLWPVSTALCSWPAFISLLAWHIALFS